MTKTMWAIFWVTLHITYLAGIFPYLMLYLLFLNSMKKLRNKVRIGNNLKKDGVPRSLRRELIKSYSNTLSLGRMLKLADLQKISKGKGFTIKLGSN